MNELYVTFGGQRYRFASTQMVRVGRSSENDVVVTDTTVSRRHVELTWSPDGWVLVNLGQSGTYLNGSPVTRLVLRGPVDLALASPQGPVVHVEALPPQLPQAGEGTGVGAPQAQAAAPGRVEAPAQVPAAGQVPAAAGRAPAQVPGYGPGYAPAPGQVPWQVPGGVPGAHPPAAGAKEEIATAFHILIPIRHWLTDPGWRQGLRLIVIPYALLPLVFLAIFASSGNLTTPGWAYSLYIAPLWAIAFWLLIRPGPVRFREIRIAIGIVVWVLLWMQLVTITINDHIGSANKPLSFIEALGVGYNEEITKALPILLAAVLVLKVTKTKLDVRMWMFLGTIAGLTFGVREQVYYTLVDILNIAHAQVNNQAVAAVLAFAERVFVDGLQHAVWAGVSAFFIGMAVNYPRRRVLLIALGVSIPAVLHGLNDWSGAAVNSIWAPVVVQAVSLFLFLGYTMSAGSIVRQVRRTPMFRGDSILMERFSEPDAAADA